jgi:hypothetical protein
MYGDIDVRLVAITSEVLALTGEPEGMEVAGPGEGVEEDPFRALAQMLPDPKGRLLNPTSKEVLEGVMAELGIEKGPGTPSSKSRLSLTAPSPRTMGEMVHTVMMGAPVERVAQEYGFPSSAGEVMRRVGYLRTRLREFEPVREWRELEVCTAVEVQGMGKVSLMGRMDLVLELVDGSYLVIDFKTGRDRPEYRAQLEVYRRMLSTMVKEPVRVEVLTTDPD